MEKSDFDLYLELLKKKKSKTSDVFLKKFLITDLCKGENCKKSIFYLISEQNAIILKERFGKKRIVREEIWILT